jgi:dTDP-4-dehydrorhamnose 3,5-epimerase
MCETVVAPSVVADVAIPHCEPGIGSVIVVPDSPKLIEGVSVQSLALWPDDRGWFLEVARIGQGPVAGFEPAATQVSSALSFPGTIKAFHFHRHQIDYWVPVAGMFQVALVDLRPGSMTCGLKNTLYIGTMRPWGLTIPAGVGHGYKVIGRDPAVLVYVTSRLYNPEDEGRIRYDEPSIGYDWELQHK